MLELYPWFGVASDYNTYCAVCFWALSCSDSRILPFVHDHPFAEAWIDSLEKGAVRPSHFFIVCWACSPQWRPEVWCPCRTLFMSVVYAAFCFDSHLSCWRVWVQALSAPQWQLEMCVLCMEWCVRDRFKVLANQYIWLILWSTSVFDLLRTIWTSMCCVCIAMFKLVLMNFCDTATITCFCMICWICVRSECALLFCALAQPLALLVLEHLSLWYTLYFLLKSVHFLIGSIYCVLFLSDSVCLSFCECYMWASCVWWHKCIARLPNSWPTSQCCQAESAGLRMAFIRCFVRASLTDLSATCELFWWPNPLPLIVVAELVVSNGCLAAVVWRNMYLHVKLLVCWLWNVFVQIADCVRLWPPLSICALIAWTWLILPVVICLSQRLSHACLSISFYMVKLRMAH